MTLEPAQRRSVPVPETMSKSGLWVFESLHDEAFSMTETEHRFPKLLYIRQGSGEVAANWAAAVAGPAGGAEASDCVAGDCILVPAGMRHRIIDAPRHPISLYGLAIDPQKIAPCAEIDTMIPIGKLPRQRMSLLNIERRFRRLLYLVSQPSSASTLSAIAAAIEIFAQLALASGGQLASENAQSRDLGDTRPLDAIDEYLLWLDLNFFEPLTVDAAARACNMSRRKFTNDFRDRTGKTWLAYLNERRIDHAKTLLRNTQSKVTSIAFQSGFDELSTFYRTFQRLTGMRPLDYRENSD
ncbi:helix-turn-helix transcriptional regulator [Novipirellula caenicola]|uniref:HTH-type transcriptional activator RhaR n=1 Tax=Novipirellula caenicola TaxID=1536901 RepID=A0ABP9W0V9_9BACT